MIPQNKSIIKIGTTQPTMEEDIWVRKSRNLFDGVYQENFGYNQTTGVLNAVSSVYSSINLIELSEGKTSIVCSKNGVRVTARFFFYSEDLAFISSYVAGSVVASIPENAKYCHFQIGVDTVENDMTGVQVEYDGVTEYEEYVEPSVFVKNSAGIYEELVSKPKGKKIVSITDSTYNLQVTVYKYGDILTISLYTTSLATAISSGHLSYNLCKLPAGIRLSSAKNYMVQTSSGVRFNIVVNQTGNIMIGYVYGAINSSSQIIDIHTIIID